MQTRILAWSTLALVLAAFANVSQASINLITNGDFELGNTGFSSGYGAIDPIPPQPYQLGPGNYAITTNPQIAHNLWYSFGDHTSGSGKMMVVNGSSNAATVVWSQNVTLDPGTYELSAWATGVYPDSPATLKFEFNGNVIGTLNLSSTVPQWLNFDGTFTTAGGTGLLTAFYNTNTTPGGNDFALDDISLQAVPEPGSMLTFAGMGLCLGFGAWRKRRQAAA